MKGGERGQRGGNTALRYTCIIMVYILAVWVTHVHVHVGSVNVSVNVLLLVATAFQWSFHGSSGCIRPCLRHLATRCILVGASTCIYM